MLQITISNFVAERTNSGRGRTHIRSRGNSPRISQASENREPSSNKWHKVWDGEELTPWARVGVIRDEVNYLYIHPGLPQPALIQTEFPVIPSG